MYEAFVYCWTDNKTGMLYIGSHKGTIDDGYVCSSKTMLHEYYNRPEDFTRQIIAEGITEDIRKLEYIILTSMNAAIDDSLYNKHNGFGSYLNEDIKKKIGKKSKELWENPSFKEKMKKIRKCVWENMDSGKKKQIAKKVSEKLLGKPKSNAHKQALKGKRPHVIQAGSMNNNAKPIETPFGCFGSIVDASNNLNMTYGQVNYRLRSEKYTEWRYII